MARACNSASRLRAAACGFGRRPAEVQINFIAGADVERTSFTVRSAFVGGRLPSRRAASSAAIASRMARTALRSAVVACPEYGCRSDSAASHAVSAAGLSSRSTSAPSLRMRVFTRSSDNGSPRSGNGNTTFDTAGFIDALYLTDHDTSHRLDLRPPTGKSRCAVKNNGVPPVPCIWGPGWESSLFLPILSGME